MATEAEIYKSCEMRINELYKEIRDIKQVIDAIDEARHAERRRKRRREHVTIKVGQGVIKSESLLGL
jgi:hypothetical protein